MRKYPLDLVLLELAVSPNPTPRCFRYPIYNDELTRDGEIELEAITGGQVERYELIVRTRLAEDNVDGQAIKRRVVDAIRGEVIESSPYHSRY